MSGTEQNSIKSCHKRFFMKKIPNPVIGTAIIALYKMQSGSIGSQIGRDAKRFWIKIIKLLSHWVTTGQKIIKDVNNKNSAAQIIIFRNMHISLHIFELRELLVFLLNRNDLCPHSIHLPAGILSSRDFLSSLYPKFLLHL